MREGAIARVLAELNEGCDVYLLEAMLCGFDMTPIEPHRMLTVTSPRTFHLHDDRERAEYFRRSLNTAAFFSFCSSLVLRKSRWDVTPVDETFMGSCWAHAARIFAMLPTRLVVRYLPEPFLDKRGDNDSFNTNGLVRRYGIAVDGYHRIADRFFGHDSREAFYIRKAVRAEQPWYGWLAAKREIFATARHHDYALFNRLVWMQYSDPSPKNWLAFLACRFTPAIALEVTKRLLDRTRRARSRLRPSTTPKSHESA